MKKVRIGDIIEIPTKKGLAYGQYTHRDKKWGNLIRVPAIFYKSRPTDFSRNTSEKEFVTFVPLQAIINRELFVVVGNVAVPEQHKVFPIFKDSITLGERDDWWLYDGKDKWFVGKLKAGQESYPDLGICNDTYVVESLELM